MRIILFDIDTTRPDHLGCYGYQRDTSPTMDKIAKEGVLFENYHVSDAPCLPSRSSLVTGQFGIRHGAVNHGGTYSHIKHDPTRGFKHQLDRTGLFGMFKHSGIKTVTISPFISRHSAWHFMTGFQEIYDTEQIDGVCPSAELQMPYAMKWLNDNGNKDNWFLHVNLWDPHTPYRTPKGYPNHFEKDPIPDWIDTEILEKHKNQVGPHTALELSMYNDKINPRFPKMPGRINDLDDLKIVFDGYDNGIRYVDDQLEKIVNYLKDNNIYDDTAIIITSDHGENLGELGIYAEHATADQFTTRVPMIIKWPGGKQNIVAKNLYYHLDLVPTISDLLNYQEKGDWDGKSYVDLILNGIESGHSHLILSQMAHVCQRSVRWDNYIYIRTYHDGYHLFPKHMLFDIVKDPHETNNIAKENQDLIYKAESMLLNWHDEQMFKMPDKVDPMWQIIKEGGPFHAKNKLKEYLPHVIKTGRKEYVDIYKEKYPSEFKD